MKKVAEPYELSRTELQIISEVSQSPGSIAQLARRIHRSSPVVAESVNRLVSKGLVDEERERRQRIISLSERKHAQLLRELLLRYPHVPWQDVLSFSGIIPLLKLERDTDSPLASRSTEWRAFRNLMSHGIVQKQAGTIQINPKFEKAEEFIKEFQSYNNQRLAREASSKAVIVWSKGSKFIIRVPEDETISDPRFKPTATTKIPEYDIPLISNVRFYFHSPLTQRIAPEEVLLHMLLTDGLTNTTYALILLAKGPIDRKKLLAKADEYGMAKQVHAMIDFLDGRKAPDSSVSLPRWEEFAEKARDYGVFK